MLASVRNVEQSSDEGAYNAFVPAHHGAGPFDWPDGASDAEWRKLWDHSLDPDSSALFKWVRVVRDAVEGRADVDVVILLRLVLLPNDQDARRRWGAAFAAAEPTSARVRFAAAVAFDLADDFDRATSDYTAARELGMADAVVESSLLGVTAASSHSELRGRYNLTPGGEWSMPDGYTLGSDDPLIPEEGKATVTGTMTSTLASLTVSATATDWAWVYADDTMKERIGWGACFTDGSLLLSQTEYLSSKNRTNSFIANDAYVARPLGATARFVRIDLDPAAKQRFRMPIKTFKKPLR